MDQAQLHSKSGVPGRLAEISADILVLEPGTEGLLPVVGNRQRHGGRRRPLPYRKLACIQGRILFILQAALNMGGDSGHMQASLA